MEQVRWCIQSPLSETEMSVACIRLYFVQTWGVVFESDMAFHNLRVVSVRDGMCYIYVQHETMCVADSSWGTFIHVAAFCV